ncbi:MAG: zinc ribbon domain-containing protein [Anaerolineales bacterium]|nr:zinc ribbon domain-containing protein [Anaerolineales bacterium]
MPLYEYQCPGCGETFDKLVSFSEADKIPVCPKCGEQNTRKMISAAAMIGGSSSRSTSSTGSAHSSPFT